MAFERFRKLAEKKGDSMPPPPNRPVFVPILKWDEMRWYMEQGMAAEDVMRALED